MSIAVPLVAAGAVTTYLQVRPDLRPEGPPMRREAARFLAENTDPAELVFTCDWDDSPELFYFNHHNHYPVMLDPNFMYFYDSELWRRWATVARGGYRGRSYDILREHYRFGVCTWDFTDLRAIVETDPRMNIVFENDNTYVFRLDPEREQISLDDFLEMSRD